jgi:protein involved in polysaccharide export with SLBB domain
MEAGGRAPGWPCLLAPLLGLLSGCALGKSNVDQALLARKVSLANPDGPAGYSVRFPDVLDVYVRDRPEWTGRRPLRPDGCIAVTAGRSLRVEGRTTREIARLLAEEAGVTPDTDTDSVGVVVAEYNSQQVFLYGQVQGGTRPVPYQGPETILELLQRVGGITAGAAPGDVQVVRAHIADGRQPEVFDIDLEAILSKNEQETNLRLQPFDQVYVGQSHWASLVKCLPPWLRPIYEDLCGLSRPRRKGPPRS